MLGEPGIGKTTELKRLSEDLHKSRQDVHYLDLKEVQNIEVFKEFILPIEAFKLWKKGQSSLTLFLDSFDEMILSQDKFSAFLSNFLVNSGGNLSQLNLRIACRNLLWSDATQSNLQKIWSEQIEIIELCPLTKKDVLDAAGLNGIDQKLFLSQITKNDLAALAGKPLTLAMLIRIFNETPLLPSGKVDLFNQGIDFLLEVDPSRNHSLSAAKTDLRKKRIIAERIAVLMTLSAKSVIALNMSETGVSEHELLVDDVCGEEFVNSDSSILIEGSEVIETLNTGVFSSRGNSRVGWAHFSFGEFLAAQYLNRHKLSWEQLRSLFFQKLFSFENYKLIPQLYETAIWLSSLNIEFYNKVLESDPEILLKSDFQNSSTDSQKKLLVQKLLNGIEAGEFIENWELLHINNYEKICHPDIVSQLKPFIIDSKMRTSTRKHAMVMLRASKSNDLKTELLAISLDPLEKIEIRSTAVLSLGNNLSKDEKTSLEQVLDQTNLKDDHQDELKGAILECLNVSYFSSQQLFDLLEAPKKSSFYGQYYYFVSYLLIPQLSKIDLKVALEWVYKVEPSDWHLDVVRRKLTEAIILIGLKRLHEPGILEFFSKVAFKRLKDDRSLMEGHTVNEEVSKEFFEILEKDVEKRRSIASGIIDVIVNNNTEEFARRHAHYLSIGETRLLNSDDFDWLVTRISSEKRVAAKSILSESIKIICDLSVPYQSNSIYKLIQTEPVVYELFKNRFAPVELGSEGARQMKEDWLEMQGLEDRWSNNRRARLSKELSIDVIKKDLSRIEKDDLDAVWQLHRDLCAYNHNLDEEDLEKLYGWELLEPDEKKLVIAIGQKYLDSNEAKPEFWLNKGKLYFPDLTAYRYVKYYANLDPEYLDQQDEVFWKKWASILIGFPHLNHDDVSSRIAQKAMMSNPQDSMRVFDSLVEYENENHGNLFITRLFDGFWNEELCDWALQKIKSGRLKKRPLIELLEKNIKFGSAKSIQYTKTLVKLPENPDGDLDFIVDLASLLLSAGEWGFISKLIQKDKEFGKLIFEDRNYITKRSQSFLHKMKEIELKEMYIWMMHEYPEDEDPNREGVHTVTARRSVTSFRNNVFSALISRGTPESCLVIEEIAKLFPDKEWITRHSLLQAKKNALENKWVPLKVVEVIQIISSLHKRSVTSAAELLDLVMETLKLFQVDLKTGEPPKLKRLWNSPRKKIGNDKSRRVYYSPKLEEDLSNEVKIFLEDSLEKKKIIVNREVQIMKGNETDVHVVAKRSEKQSVITEKVIIEVKGCWNPDLEKSMKSQLVDRYLKISGLTHGIYLIGWYKCDKWDDPDDNGTKKKCPSYEFEEAQAHFEDQARGLSTGDLDVRSCVLDVRI